MDEKPPSKVFNHKRSSGQYRKPNRDFRTICGLLARSRQMEIGVIRSACLRANQ